MRRVLARELVPGMRVASKLLTEPIEIHTVEPVSDTGIRVGYLPGGFVVHPHDQEFCVSGPFRPACAIITDGRETYGKLFLVDHAVKLEDNDAALANMLQVNVNTDAGEHMAVAYLPDDVKLPGDTPIYYNPVDRG
jgi:hypothetical protein